MELSNAQGMRSRQESQDSEVYPEDVVESGAYSWRSPNMPMGPERVVGGRGPRESWLWAWTAWLQLPGERNGMDKA